LEIVRTWGPIEGICMYRDIDGRISLAKRELYGRRLPWGRGVFIGKFLD